MKISPAMATPPGGKVLPKLESPDTQTMNNVPDHKTNTTYEKQRGRTKGRVAGKGKHAFENMPLGREGPGEDLSSADEGGPSRKRRRSRKGLDKKYECPTEGCGKAYSRAEHLYRHQLNHSAKTIFYCNHDGCDRHFVRQDLCNRHRDRHEARGPGSQLGRIKDSAMYNPSPSVNATHPGAARGSLSPETIKTEDIRPSQLGHFNLPHDNTSGPFSPTATSTDASNTPTSSWFPRSNSDHNVPPVHEASSRSGYPMAGHSGMKTEFNGRERPASFSNAPPVSEGMFIRSPTRPEAGRYGLDGMQSLSQASPFLNSSNYSSTAPMHQSIPQRMAESNFVQHDYHPPFMLATGPMSQPQGIDPPYSVPPSNQSVPMDFQNDPASNNQIFGNQYLDDMSCQVMPFLFGGGGEGYDRSPIAMGDNLVNFFFVPQDGPPNLDTPTQQPSGTYSDIPPQFLQHAWEPQLNNFSPRTMAVNTILQPTLPDKRISDDKAEKVFKEIRDRFNESEENAIPAMKSKLLGGDRAKDTHLLSTKKMQLYIETFFEQFHLQVPILHQPTFTADKTPNLLLIAIMAIGAACLDRRYDYELAQLAASLSNFLAGHLRWEIFSHKDFRPPGSLWMFQTLLLLELYEKLYSNRVLHERAHIHHATTITLMRRGRSMTTHSADVDQQSPVRRSDRRQSPVTEDAWWNNFIEAESTHRCTYAAFLIDSTHAVMFGHSSSLYVHELALPLPCDEKIWAATTGAEAARLHAILKSNTSTGGAFLNGLRKLIHGDRVETDAFGWTVLMAGLLNVLWHMKQRDAQLQSIKVRQAALKWKAMLLRGFDNWSTQFDDSVAYIQNKSYHHKDELVSESRTVLHHLAHMAMHVDIIECQIYAHAKILLGRTIYQNDRAAISKKWEKELKTSEMRDAVYYALQFLKSILLPDSRTLQSSAYGNEDTRYRARDDPLLNRPWVLYFSVLIVWCYGYAKEGPPQAPIPSEDNPEEQVREMRVYLEKFYDPHAKDYDYLANMQGFNRSSGLLMIVRTCFKDCRWQLLQEAETLLTNCIRLNARRQVS